MISQSLRSAISPFSTTLVIYEAALALGLVNPASPSPPFLGSYEPFGLGRYKGGWGQEEAGSGMCVCVRGMGGALQGPHVPQGTSSKKFHAPARTRKIKDVLPYAIIYPEQVMKASHPLITGQEAN